MVAPESSSAVPPPGRTESVDGGESVPVANHTMSITAMSPSAPRVRGELDRLVRLELQGPAGGPDEEVDESSIKDRYLVGMLAPRDAEVGADQDDDLAVNERSADENNDSDRSGIRKGTMFPSSLGISFVVAKRVTQVRVTATWGQYERIDSGSLQTQSGNPQKVWKRTPYGGESFTVALREGPIPKVSPDQRKPEVHVEGIVRTLNDQWVVTLFLVNDQEEVQDEKAGSAWLFQVELAVEGVDGSSVFERRPSMRGKFDDGTDLSREEREMAMLYRRYGEFAVGHGTATHAEVEPNDAWKARRLTTVAMPTSEVERVDAPTASDPGFEGLRGLELDMKVLATKSRAELGPALRPLVQAYQRWIEGREGEITDPAARLDEYQSPARDAITSCRAALRRVEAGIALLERDEQAAESFRFANQAMWQQRIRSKFAEERRRGRKPDLDAIDADPTNHLWRPFQLAFILLNLPSCTDLHHPERSHATEAIADLLWFPTGGGKTEAYLGLAAYVMGLRRLQGMVEGHSGEKGIAVLMRYTLRLLTLQQFQRASVLVCACESIRREALEKGDKRWGEEPFRIGIWVGARTTPNWTEEAHEYIQEARGGGSKGFHKTSASGSPAQLTSCPWCGSEIKEGRDIDVETVTQGRCRTITYCGDALGQCLFSKAKSKDEGLPVLVVDEELYRRPPSLLIATVDKFAQMPWNGATQNLFGRVSRLCPRHGFRAPDLDDADSHPAKGSHPATKTIDHPPLRPPDLVIQDELHLISGPLGSLVGLYETAVDAMCTWTVGGKTVRPKIVVSTATIRNAAHQVRSLFLRKVAVFPPPGTDIADNFFSVRRKSSEDTPGRLYVGVCAPGRRLKGVLIRTYTAYLAATWLLYEKQYGKHTDPWCTLVGYFNSLRELGGMRRLVDDDVANRLLRMNDRGLARRPRPFVEELTSRRNSTEIPGLLDLMEAVFDPALEKQREAERKAGKTFTSQKPIDVLLSTNMISVGVDIGRLGLMVVAGQPKSTAEYIQATSRVGRRHPGIVCTVYNWVRPRDLSHYERFGHYHATFYEQVEPLSVTPFSTRALDRGITALLMSLSRLRSSDLSPNDNASQIQLTNPSALAAIEEVRARIAGVSGNQLLADEIAARLKRVLDDWVDLARKKPGMTFKKMKGGSPWLLQKPEEQDWETFTCLNSLRDVEPSPGLVLQEDATKGGC
jgi:hypothetical protein